MSSQTATPPTIPGSLNVDTLEVNKVTKLIGQVVGDALSSLNTWKGAVDAATTANITLSGTQTVDGVVLVAGDKVLVKNQATGSQNGLYIVQDLTWFRSDDLVLGSSAAGTAVFVTDGTVNDDQIFVCTNAAGSDIVATDALVFATLTATMDAAGATTQVQFNSAGQFAADAGFTYNAAGAVTSTVSMNSVALNASSLVTGNKLVNSSKATIAQLTSPTTTVPFVAASSGVITTFAGTAAAGATETFLVTTSAVLSGSVILTSFGYTGTGFPIVKIGAIVNATSFEVSVTNTAPAAALNASVTIHFMIV